MWRPCALLNHSVSTATAEPLKSASLPHVLHVRPWRGGRDDAALHVQHGSTVPAPLCFRLCGSALTRQVVA